MTVIPARPSVDVSGSTAMSCDGVRGLPTTMSVVRRMPMMSVAALVERRAMSSLEVRVMVLKSEA